MLCPMVDGQRQAIAVRAREVYRGTQTDQPGEVSGANSVELAQSLFDDIQETYLSVEESTMKGAWMGTTCDGPYQAENFGVTLNRLLRHEQDDSTFSAVLWDAPHFLDLAFSDVFDGKVGNSKELIQRLVERSSMIHKIFQRGKLLSSAKEIATTDDTLTLRLTSRTCSTRFAPSQYVEFKKLLVSLPLFIKTFQELCFSQMKEYMIAGKDFVLDLCGVTDILRPIMEMFVELQGLGTPCWKVITWWEKVNMEQLQDEFSLNNPTFMLPSLKANIADVKLHLYQGTKLVPAWIITSTNTVRDETGKKTIIDSWNAREIKDVENDLKTFVADLITSFDSRVRSCTKDLQNVLVCMDLDTLFTLLCGERLANGKVKLSLGEAKLEVHGQENFQRFFNYICSLPHIRGVQSKRPRLRQSKRPRLHQSKRPHQY